MKWEFDALRMLAKNNSVPGFALNDVLDELEKTQAEVTKLTEKLNDWAETYAKIIEDKTCPSDEYHCVCVPALREEISRLRSALEKYADRGNWLHINPDGFYKWFNNYDPTDIARAALEPKS